MPDDLIELLRQAMKQGRVTITPVAPHDGELAALDALCHQFGLRTSEGRLFDALLKHEFLSKAEAQAALNPKPGSKSAAVTLCGLRKKLTPHGIEITTAWNRGFRLARESRSRITKMLAAYNEKAAA
jgi:hypothetical protein